ncbi:hypothetical protein JQ633_18280 [Bradyrhizobium tropiciagri]|uniref:hypothetical protein n=1 Tax=Bradyrhizobium tropiciagri TaxID=312253 RepID=UPI001BABAC60|nr:hypothetical protein [Bradyrhizobium tropiciagri]MBR0872319.1 hypothetical protein [Bradyrhizobium tropiciagri]
MRFNLAILTVLAAKPEQRIAVDDVSREVKRMIASGDEAAKLKRSSELGDADIFQSGLASINDDGMQITDKGLSMWHALQASRVERERSPPQSGLPEIVVSDTDHAAVMAAIDRSDDVDLELPAVTSEDRGERMARLLNHITATPEAPAREAAAPETHTIPEPAFGSIQQAGRNDSRLSALTGLLGSEMPGLARMWRRRPARHVPDRKTEGNVGMTRLALAGLSLISIIACGAAAVAIGQISTLKSEITALRREQAPLKERLAKLEQAEGARREAAAQEAAQARAEAERRASESAGEQSLLNLSREEIQLVREYIKAAPSAGAPAVTTKVGDPVTGGMIPLPSPLTDKVPRLLGARFATRNGAIIISTRNSRRVDAVLMPN